MIRVTVELCPGGDESRARVLGIARIANDLHDSLATGGDLGSYRATFSKWAPKESEVWKRGTVRGFDRKGRGPWDLLFLALRSAVGARNPAPSDSAGGAR